MSVPGFTTFASDGSVVAELRGAVALLRLRRPDVLNALTPAMVYGLYEAVEQYGADPAVRGLVMTGEGRAFCAGADIGFESGASEEEFAHLIDGLQGLARLLRDADLYVVAAVNGVAVGGGFELALGCDARVASPGSVLGFPEVTLGLTVTGGVTFRLPRLVGSSRALELLISGRSVSAEEALGLGLVDRISPQVVTDAIRLAGLAENVAPSLLRTIKAQLYGGETATLDEVLLAEKEVIIDAFRRPAAREGLGAFLTRRRASERRGDGGQDPLPGRPRKTAR